MKTLSIAALLALLVTFSLNPAQAQLRKLKERLEQTIEEATKISIKTGGAGTTNESSAPGASRGNAGRPGNCSANSSFVCAKSADPNSSYTGRFVDGAKQHFYKVESEQAGTLMILMDPVPLDIGVQLNVYNEAQESYGVANTQAGKALYYYVAVPQGTSYLSIQGGYPFVSRDSYTLSLTMNVDETAMLVKEQRCGGVNGRFVCAKAMPLNGETTAYLVDGAREHFYQLNSDTPGTLDITVDPVPTDIGLTLITYNAAQERIGSHNTNIGQNLFYGFAVPPGTAYFSIQGSYPYTTLDPYTLKMVFSGVEKYEPNNTFVQAGRIKRGEVVEAWISTEGDLDYYGVDVTQPGSVTVTIDPMPADVQMRLNVFTPRQEPLGQTMTKAQGMRLEYTFQATTPGTYYLLLSNARPGGSRDAYALVVR